MRVEERIYWPSLGTERAGIVGEGRKHLYLTFVVFDI